jgi:DNA-directed RNA polymerase beta subunit
MRALGLESDREIMESIVYDLKSEKTYSMTEALMYSMAEGDILTERNALLFIGDRKTNADEEYS